ncbi:hypothetical protein A0J61_00229 [Choanephora cucurbitarum]|uniref:Uncharacterized protein n=1 Tax=Choanephora cucurbitarum TaxID=101091 RepID=A0A1C7NRI1_9FUNG|nr:hypothetical protein A0J61_00229 [Choanephora cucurbitarum]
MSAETKLKEELDKSKQQKEEQHQQDPDDAPGLLPPQALLSTPAPSTTEDTSALLSPWWSEEPQSVDDVHHSEDNPTEQLNDTITLSEPEINKKEEKDHHIEHTSPITNQSNGHQNSILNISVLGVSRSSPKESKFQWKERCMLLAFTELQQQRQLQQQQQQEETNEKDSQKELLDILDRSKDCSMVCFLRTSRQLSKAQTSSLFHFNPFAGMFVSVAKSPARCKEHLLDATNMVTQKSFSDYYTMELGEELSHSGEHVTKAIQRTFGPLQRLTERYVNSWRDGSQQAFFSKFWSSLQKGDAFYLVKDSTKRLFENALGHDKKPSDKK